MTLILRLLLLSTLFVSCLSAPKFHLIETEDDGGEGTPVEVVDPPRLRRSSTEDPREDDGGVVDGERGVDRWGGYDDYL